ncbi:sensor histidine kinase [soil metagenome]
MIAAPFLVLGLLLILSAVIGPRVADRGWGTASSILLAPLHPATWAAVAAIFVGFWVGLFAFTFVVGAFSAGASLVVVGVGFAIAALGIEVARLTARFERRRMRWVDPRPLRAHAYRPYGTGLRELVLALYFDPSRWRDVVYVLVAFPLMVLEFVAVVVLWSVAIALVCLPIWYAMGDLPFALSSVSLPAIVARVPIPAPWLVAAGSLGGVVLVFVAASVTRGLIALHRAVVAGLLCVSEEQALARRVQTLETSRRTVMDVEASELRRIERDLHDGAQQRLVMLSIDLGLAAERIDTDPEAAKGLVVEARDQARQALAELRDLVRGIAPSILMDRGLVPALSALAGRSPVPTGVVSTIPEGHRLPDSVERAAYFVVAEAITNVAKHAAAARCEVRCALEAGRLVVEIEDDGVGGARPESGGGLAGLAGRVEALDGRLVVTSPDGGPTVVRAEIPVSVPTGAWVVPGQDPR